MADNWKLKLKYGKTKTKFTHFTVIAQGITGDLAHGFECKPGNAWMSMKTWSNSTDEAMKMIQSIGKQIGFECKGKIEIFNTEPTEPPREVPFGYEINFTPYDSQ